MAAPRGFAAEAFSNLRVVGNISTTWVPENLLYSNFSINHNKKN